MNDGHFHTFHFNLLKGSSKGFNRSLYIGFNDDINGFHFSSLQGIKEIFKADTVGCLTLFHQRTFRTFFTGCTRRFFIFINRKVVTRHWCFVQTSDRNWSRWSSYFHTTAKVIGHGTDTSESITNNDWVLDIQSTLLNQKGCNRTFSFIQARFDNRTDGTNSWICFEFLDFSHKKDRFQELIDILVELGRDFYKLRISTPGS